MLTIRAYFKRSSDKENSLPSKLPNDCPTRPWCGLCDFFSAFFNSYSKIKDLIPDKIDMPPNLDLIKIIADALEEFKIIFKKLEAASSPTVHLVAICFRDIHKFLENWPRQLEDLKNYIKQGNFKIKKTSLFVKFFTY